MTDKGFEITLTFEEMNILRKSLKDYLKTLIPSNEIDFFTTRKKEYYIKNILSKIEEAEQNKTNNEQMDELKNKISLELKNPVLQQGFEIICARLEKLEKEKRF